MVGLTFEIYGIESRVDLIHDLVYVCIHAEKSTWEGFQTHTLAQKMECTMEVVDRQVQSMQEKSEVKRYKNTETVQ